MKAIDTTAEYLEWRRTAGKGDKCIVRDTRHGNEQAARIKRTHRAGCDLQFEDGHLAFIPWKEMFPPPPEPRLANRTSLGSLSDVMPPSVAAIVSTRALRVAPLPASAPPPVPEPQRRAGRTKGLNAHMLNAIGQILRAERYKRGMNQETLAEKLGIADTQLSRIETGDAPPSDEVLLLAAELFDLPLELLEKARDGGIEADPVAAATRIAALEEELKLARHQCTTWREQFENKESLLNDAWSQLKVATARADELNERIAQRPAQAPGLDAATFAKVHAFVEHMAERWAIPTDATKREAWFTAAWQMYQASHQ
jgi:transcriptional regulator with XRE-family HTH domain